ncbi:MAG: hypothetical protein ACLU38_10205 [Dysosmobacter sp.]
MSPGATDSRDSYPTTIEAVCKDRLNLPLDISSALSTTKTFVLGLNTAARRTASPSSASRSRSRMARSCPPS